MRMRTLSVVVLAVAALAAGIPTGAPPAMESANLIENGTLERVEGKLPVGFQATGSVEYGYLGDPRRDMASHGFLLNSAGAAGEVGCIVSHLDAKAGRWFRFTFRGLPQANFAVADNDLYMKVAFFGDGGKVGYDAKAKRIYEQIETARRDLSVNGVRHAHGAEVWETYQLDFMLPFPQVDTLKLSVGFGHGAGKGGGNAAFLVDDFSLVRIAAPAGASVDAMPKQPGEVTPTGTLLPLGGRWFYDAKPGETAAPAKFDASNVDRLLYHDAVYTAPFAGNTTAWLRVGNKNADGSAVTQDRLVEDNVTITFDATSMAVHTHGIPNHPTGRFPEQGFGNPNAIQDRLATYYIPLNPKENPQHVVTTADNGNHALHMGPIGVAVNGVVFFNPFDMGNTDATNMMDRCCGHPNQDNQYHYHKYPICIDSPWADEGKAHSALIGFAFDGYPVYGPYESADVMAKDVKGEHALNAFNMHYDEQRGWHYHVTPGQFPYLIGGFWGVEDSRDARHWPPGGGGMGRGPGGGSGRGPGGRPPFPPPPGE